MHAASGLSVQFPARRRALGVLLALLLDCHWAQSIQSARLSVQSS
jgi:hypothetical protein